MSINNLFYPNDFKLYANQLEIEDSILINNITVDDITTKTLSADDVSTKTLSVGDGTNVTQDLVTVNTLGAESTKLLYKNTMFGIPNLEGLILSMPTQTGPVLPQCNLFIEGPVNAVVGAFGNDMNGQGRLGFGVINDHNSFTNAKKGSLVMDGALNKIQLQYGYDVGVDSPLISIDVSPTSSTAVDMELATTNVTGDVILNNLGNFNAFSSAGFNVNSNIVNLTSVSNMTLTAPNLIKLGGGNFQVNGRLTNVSGGTGPGDGINKGQLDAKGSFSIHFGANLVTLLSHCLANGNPDSTEQPLANIEAKVSIPLTSTLRSISYANEVAGATMRFFKNNVSQGVFTLSHGTLNSGVETGLNIPYTAGDNMVIQYDVGVAPQKSTFTCYFSN